jgi:nucleoside triphosphatase
MESRLVVVPVIRDESDRVLLCKMAAHRGVFPGQWGLPGGGVEAGERIDEALRREVREELGAQVSASRPLFFKDGVHVKLFPDGARRSLYMVFLLYECRLHASPLTLNEEFSEAEWVALSDLGRYDLNSATVDTFRRLGWLPAGDSDPGRPAPRAD